MTFFPRGNHLEIECLRLDLYNVFSFPIPSICLMGSVLYYYLHHLTFSCLAKHFLVLLLEQEPPSKNIKPWTTRSSLNIKPSKSRAGLGHAGHSSVWPRSFSLWSNGFFLSLIWWVLSLSDLMGHFFYFLLLFFNLDFRWLLGVDLVECFVLVDLCLCFVLAEISSFQSEWTNRVFECWYINRVSNPIRIWKPTLKDSIYSPKSSLLASRCY